MSRPSNPPAPTGPAPMPPVSFQARLLGTVLGFEVLIVLGLHLVGVSGLSALLSGLGQFAALALFVVFRFSRTTPVYRAIGRTPPSPAALRDSFRFPAVAFAAVLLVHFAFAGGYGFAAPAPVGIAAALVLLSGAGFASAAIFVQSRRGFSTWLAWFDPRQLATELVLSTSSWLGRTMSGAVLGVVAAVTLLWLHEVPGLSGSGSAGVLFVPLFAAGIAAVWATVVSRRLDHNLEQLAGQISERQAQDWPTSQHFVWPISALADDLHRHADAVLISASKEDDAAQSVRDLQLQKMLFMASTGHDLRSPLNAILGFSELLLSEPTSLTSAQQESIRAIIRSGEELLHLLRDILESARIAAGRLSLDMGWVPAVEILTDAVEQGHRAMDRDKLRIDAEVQPGLPPVFVDRGRILQAISCLLRHAGRSMDQGVIELKARVHRGTSGQQLQVDVVDSTEGLRSEDRERVFEAFQEVSLPSGRRLGGLGLALSLTRSLVVAHGGDVSAKNTPGIGTTFTILIPVGTPPN